jgi:hypothetical protein
LSVDLAPADINAQAKFQKPCISGTEFHKL